MQIHEHRGFNIEVHKIGEGYVPEIYRKGKLIHTVSHKDSNFTAMRLLLRQRESGSTGLIHQEE